MFLAAPNKRSLFVFYPKQQQSLGEDGEAIGGHGRMNQEKNKVVLERGGRKLQI